MVPELLQTASYFENSATLPFPFQVPVSADTSYYAIVLSDPGAFPAGASEGWTQVGGNLTYGNQGLQIYANLTRANASLGFASASGPVSVFLLEVLDGGEPTGLIGQAPNSEPYLFTPKLAVPAEALAVAIMSADDPSDCPGAPGWTFVFNSVTSAQNAMLAVRTLSRAAEVSCCKVSPGGQSQNGLAAIFYIPTAAAPHHA